MEQSSPPGGGLQPSDYVAIPTFVVVLVAGLPVNVFVLRKLYTQYRTRMKRLHQV